VFDSVNKQACWCDVQPATVSRCGMIYLEPVTLGWRPLMLSWLNTLPEVLTTNNGQFIVDFFEWVIDPLLEFVRKNCKVSSEYFCRNCRSGATKLSESKVRLILTNRAYTRGDRRGSVTKGRFRWD